MFPQDLQFLVNESCFLTPRRDLLDALVWEYFLNVHPLLPILNEADFWAAYHSTGRGSDSQGSLSIMVLQAIMFSSCDVRPRNTTASKVADHEQFVSPDVVRSLGFTTVLDAKKAFYRRTSVYIFHPVPCRAAG